MGTPISGLPAEGTVLTTDIVPLVSDGVTKSATIAEIGTAIGGGGGGAGVDSLAGLTGALTLESTDSTIAITPTGTSIDLTVVGGGGGGGGGDFADLADVNIGTAAAGKFLTLSDVALGERQHATAATTSGSLQVTFAEPPQADNLIVAYVSTISANPTPTLSGFSEVGQSEGANSIITVLQKLSSDGASDQTLVFGGIIPNTGSVVVVEYVGAVECAGLAGNNGTYTSPSIAVPSGSIAVAAFSAYAGFEPSTADSGWEDIYIGSPQGGGGGAATEYASKLFTAAATTDYTFSAAGYGGAGNSAGVIAYITPASGQPYVFAPVTAADVVPSEYDSMILSEPGLMYYYPLSDTTTPICLATGRGSIVNGSPTYSATSLIASGDPAMTFPTDSDSLGFDRAFATFANTPFSWECFIELPSLPSSNLKFICMENSGTVSGSALYITTAGRLMVEFDDEADLDGGFAFTAGTPYHVVLVFDGGSLTTWVNGVADYIGRGRPLDVGSGGGNPFISGGSITIQKVAFYSVMLTKRRILAHYAQIAANAPSYPLIP